MWLFNVHIAQYDAASYHGHDPERPRKLLLHKKEMVNLAALAKQKSLTLVPVRLYIKGGVAKIALALARGKKQYDKRETIAKRDQDRELDRELKSRNR